MVVVLANVIRHATAGKAQIHVGPETVGLRHWIGALSEIDGAVVEGNLRKGLQEKVADLRQVVNDLGLGSQTSEELKAAIIRDGSKAKEAADNLYRKTAEFAHILDPNVVAPERPEPCVKPSG